MLLTQLPPISNVTQAGENTCNTQLVGDSLETNYSSSESGTIQGRELRTCGMPRRIPWQRERHPTSCQLNKLYKANWDYKLDS